MKRLAFILAIALLAFTGCKKGKSDFTLKGVITDGTFGGGLNGAVVKLYEVEAGGGSSTLISQSTLSSNGEYSFTFPRNKVESYVLSIRKDNYFEVDASIPFSTMTIEEDNVRDYSSTAKSWARLTFTTTDPNNSLKYVKQDGKTDCAECCDNAENFLYGAVDTTFLCPNDGNTSYRYFYWVLGTNISGEKSAITTAFDTVNIVLNY